MRPARASRKRHRALEGRSQDVLLASGMLGKEDCCVPRCWPAYSMASGEPQPTGHGSALDMVALRLLYRPGVGQMAQETGIPHKGNIQDEVIEVALRGLNEFAAAAEHAEAMKTLPLHPPEEIAFATAALALRFGELAIEGRRPPSGPCHCRAAERSAPTRRPGPQPAARLPACSVT